MPREITADKMIMLTRDLPPMPVVAKRVMSVVNDPSTDATQLQEIISKDQAMTSQILKIANSALYSCSRKIEKLSDAIVMLGFNSIRSLSIMNATSKLYTMTGGGRVMGLKDKLLWEHSLGAAVAAKLAAMKVKPSYAEQAFMGGLMHDLGKLVFHQKIPGEFDQIVEEVYNTGRHFAEVENEKLGFTHAEVGARLIKKWKLTEDFERAVGEHHNIEPEMETDSDLVYYIDFANNFCHKFNIGFLNEPDMDLAGEISSITLGITGDFIEELEESVKNILREEFSLFK